MLPISAARRRRVEPYNAQPLLQHYGYWQMGTSNAARTICLRPRWRLGHVQLGSGQTSVEVGRIVHLESVHQHRRSVFQRVVHLHGLYDRECSGRLSSKVKPTRLRRTMASFSAVTHRIHRSSCKRTGASGRVDTQSRAALGVLPDVHRAEQHRNVCSERSIDAIPHSSSRSRLRGGLRVFRMAS